MRNELWPGGELVIEIPDRMLDPYATALRRYREKRPDEPFGTLRDPKPDSNGEYSPRYFPDRNELVLLLKSVGFDIYPEKDIQTYFIEGEDPETGQKTLRVKELFITARKPKY